MKKEDKILKTIKTKMETKTINKNKAVELIKSSNGKFFTVTFLNKQNTARTINGRLKAPATKSGKNNATALGYITMYSNKDKGYRNVNSQTVQELKINGSIYNVR